MKLAEKVAATFVYDLQAALSPSEWKEMRKRNRAEETTGICHSHDFCDANMVMQEALFKHGVKVWTDDGAEMLDAAVDLWNEAWEIAAPKLGAVKKRRLCIMDNYR